MSILGQADPGDLPLAVLLFLLTAAALVAARFLGLFRRDAVLGPDRTPTPQAGWPVIATLGTAILLWLGTQMAFVAHKQALWSKTAHDGPFKISDLSPPDLAFLATVPGLVTVAAIVACLLYFPRDQRPRLGASLPSLPAGVTKGLGAILLVLPLVLLVSAATESFYHAIDFRHPGEHDLLHAMRESTPAVRWLLIAGAVLVAPVVEELLFRGLFQTLLVWAFNQRALPRDVPPSKNRLAIGRWLAILTSSIIFASIHDKWSVPPIFVLALCLGFFYERTGNLWTTITLHSLFNGFQTAYFLTAVAHRP